MKKITRKFLCFVKNVSASREFPPSFNPDEWNGKTFNCYAYCLDICANVVQHLINPGFLSRRHRNVCEDTKECIISHFLEDCLVLKLKVIKTTFDEPISDKAYKIAFYLNDDGYHCARQDSDGGWSEKEGWCGKIRRLNKEDIRETLHGYKFIGVFRVSRKE